MEKKEPKMIGMRVTEHPVEEVPVGLMQLTRGRYVGLVEQARQLEVGRALRVEHSHTKPQHVRMQFHSALRRALPLEESRKFRTAIKDSVLWILKIE